MAKQEKEPIPFDSESILNRKARGLVLELKKAARRNKGKHYFGLPVGFPPYFQLEETPSEEELKVMISFVESSDDKEPVHQEVELDYPFENPARMKEFVKAASENRLVSVLFFVNAGHPLTMISTDPETGGIHINRAEIRVWDERDSSTGTLVWRY